MKRTISVLGSTGSIGVQTLEAAKNLNIDICALTANRNIDLLEQQARVFRPRLISVGSSNDAIEIKKRLAGHNIEIMYGLEGLKTAATMESANTIVVSIVGIAGLIPTMEAILSGKNIALANKETLVTAGSIIMSEAERLGVNIFPIDSEHSAIFQCLAANRREDAKRILLTASGGPFRGMSKRELVDVTASQALQHPNWSMGNKITIDSATLMNKGLEVIEARWLFDFEPERIKVVVHPQSIIHSMVEYVDGSIIAQLGPPDMRIPIQLALTWPERSFNSFSRLDLFSCGSLTFEEPDIDTFGCLRLAFEALKAGGTMPAVMNGANEAAVDLFLKGKISFLSISEIIERVMLSHTVNTMPCLDDIIEADRWARGMVGGNI